MTKIKKMYMSPTATAVEIGTESLICASPLHVIIGTDLLNSGGSNPLQDMDYNSVYEEF